MDYREQRQRPFSAQEGSNIRPTPSNMNKNWAVSSPTQGLEEAMQQMSLQPRDPRAGLEASVGPYPERPGEPDCVYYSRTGFCAFGMNCRFNHPPNLKQVPQVEEELPERVGQLECQYYLKMGTCKFGATCKYSHSDGKTGSAGQAEFNFLGLPMRQGEKECAYYMRTGSCKYGVTCKYHHPEPAAVGTVVPVSSSATHATVGFPSAAPSSTAAPYSPGLPSRPLPTAAYVPGAHLQGSSAYMNVMYPPPQGMPSMPGWNPNYQGPVTPPKFSEGKQHPPGMGLVNAATQPNNLAVSGVQVVLTPSEPVSSAAIGHLPIQSQAIVTQKETFPERPGQPECQYFLKTGDCKFGAACRYHHPKERVEQSSASMHNQMGLPLRPGQPTCAFYSRYGICKFGPICKYDHPLTGLHSTPSAPVHSEHNGAPNPRGGSTTSTHLRSSASETSQKISKIKD